MDLALALWQINPAAEYRLTDDRAAILEWRGPGAQPTQAQLDAAWSQCLAASAAAAKLATFRQAHQAALAASKPTLIPPAGDHTSSDIAALPGILAALASGQVLTPLQQAQRDRFFLRALIALGGI